MIIDFNFDNYSFNKNFFKDYKFLCNNTHYNNNFNNSNNNDSNISLTFLIKKYI